MTWLSDLWSGASQTLGKVYDAVKNTAGTIYKTAKNWAQGRFLAPGMNACGPGNPTSEEYLRENPPVDASDRACLQHDLDYEAFRKQKDAGRINDKELRDLVRESDDRLISNLRADPNRAIGSYLSELGIRAKKKAEDWGLLSPEKFVT